MQNQNQINPTNHPNQDHSQISQEKDENIYQALLGMGIPVRVAVSAALTNHGSLMAPYPQPNYDLNYSNNDFVRQQGFSSIPMQNSTARPVQHSFTSTGSSSPIAGVDWGNGVGLSHPHPHSGPHFAIGAHRSSPVPSVSPIGHLPQSHPAFAAPHNSQLPSARPLTYSSWQSQPPGLEQMHGHNALNVNVGFSARPSYLGEHPHHAATNFHPFQDYSSPLFTHEPSVGVPLAAQPLRGHFGFPSPFAPLPSHPIFPPHAQPVQQHAFPYNQQLHNEVQYKNATSDRSISGGDFDSASSVRHAQPPGLGNFQPVNQELSLNSSLPSETEKERKKDDLSSAEIERLESAMEKASIRNAPKQDYNGENSRVSKKKNENVSVVRKEESYYDRDLPPLKFLRTAFSRQVETIVQDLLPTPDEYNRNQDSLVFLESLVKKIFPMASVLPFGSTASGLSLRGAADMDLTVIIDDEHFGESSGTLYRQWKESESEYLKQFEIEEKQREEEWLQKVQQEAENKHGDELSENGEDHHERESEEEGSEKKERVFRKRTPRPFSTAHFVLGKIHKSLEQESRVTNAMLLPNTRVPIIKMKDSITKLGMDIGFNNHLAVHNTRLIQTYSQLDQRFKTLAMFVKYWSKRKTINDTYSGTLSSYAYVLMVIHYLQNACSPPVLPCLQRLGLSKNSKNLIRVDDQEYDIYFMDNIDRIKTLFRIGQNQQSIGELTSGFFNYYAHIFDYKTDVACIRLGKTLTKEEKNWIPLVEQKKKQLEGESEDPSKNKNDVDDNTDKQPHPNEQQDPNAPRKKMQRYWICIEDPFELEHNLGRPVGRDSLYFIRGEFLQAMHTLSSSKSYHKNYIISVKNGNFEGYKGAPELAEKICEESQFKTREEHKVRNKTNMEVSQKRRGNKQQNPKSE